MTANTDSGDEICRQDENAGAGQIVKNSCDRIAGTSKPIYRTAGTGQPKKTVGMVQAGQGRKDRTART
jgi:hypothetical protein